MRMKKAMATEAKNMEISAGPGRSTSTPLMMTGDWLINVLAFASAKQSNQMVQTGANTGALA
jgi:hypothetical protein